MVIILKNNVKILTMFIVGLFVLAGTYTPVVAEAQTMVTGAKILIYTGNDASYIDVENFYDNYTTAGNTVNVTSSYDFDDLVTDGFDAVLMPHAGNFTAGNLTSLDTWFDTGDKLLWVSGDSDYGGYFLANGTNPVFAAVGSELRLDAGAIDDVNSSDGSGYRVVANDTGASSPLVDYVTDGFESTIFHGPTSVIWWDGADYRDLRNHTLNANIEIIIKSHTTAKALDQDLSISGDDFYAYSEIKGSYPMLAVETIGTSMVVVGGESNFADYKNMYGTIYEKAGTHHEGSLIVDNLFAYFFVETIGFSSVDVVVRTVTETETETETETKTENFTIVETTTEVTTDVSTFTETKTDTPISLTGPIIALFAVAASVALIRRRK